MMRHTEITQRKEKEPPMKRQKGFSSRPQMREKEPMPLATNKMLQFTSPTHLPHFKRLQE